MNFETPRDRGIAGLLVSLRSFAWNNNRDRFSGPKLMTADTEYSIGIEGQPDSREQTVAASGSSEIIEQKNGFASTRHSFGVLVLEALII